MAATPEAGSQRETYHFFNYNGASIASEDKKHEKREHSDPSRFQQGPIEGTIV